MLHAVRRNGSRTFGPPARADCASGAGSTDADLVELADADKPAILRPYLQRWKWEVGQFFDGIGPDSTDEQLLAVAPGYPVFAVVVR